MDALPRRRDRRSRFDIIVPQTKNNHPLPIAIDSGAFSIFNRHIVAQTAAGRPVKGSAAQDYSARDYHKTEDFKAYLASYIEFLHGHAKLFSFYVTLDIIFQPEATWEVYKELKANGLKPLPVYHFGEDRKYLERYMRDTDYVGMGGLGHEINKKRYQSFADPSWDILCDGNRLRNAPTHRVHGFAMGGYELMMRYPWASVDATSPFYFGRMGSILVPQMSRSGPNYAVTANQIPVTTGRAHVASHMGHLHDDSVRDRALAEHLAQLGLTKQDVAEEYIARDIANLHFTNELTRAVSKLHSERIGKPHKMVFYASGRPSTGNATLLLLAAEWLHKLSAQDHLCYLGTYFKDGRRILNDLLEGWYRVSLENGRSR